MIYSDGFGGHYYYKITDKQWGRIRTIVENSNYPIIRIERLEGIREVRVKINNDGYYVEQNGDVS